MLQYKVSKLFFLSDKSTLFLPYLKNKKGRKHQNSNLIPNDIKMPLKKLCILSNLCSLKIHAYLLFLHKAKKILADALLCDLSLLEKPSLISNPQTSITPFLFYCHSFPTVTFINFIFLHPRPSLSLCNEMTTHIFHWNCPRDKQHAPNYQSPQALLLTTPCCWQLTSTLTLLTPPPSLASMSRIPWFHSKLPEVFSCRHQSFKSCILWWLWSKGINFCSVKSFSHSTFTEDLLCVMPWKLNRKYLITALKSKQAQNKNTTYV